MFDMDRQEHERRSNLDREQRNLAKELPKPLPLPEQLTFKRDYASYPAEQDDLGIFHTESLQSISGSPSMMTNEEMGFVMSPQITRPWLIPNVRSSLEAIF